MSNDTEQSVNRRDFLRLCLSLGGTAMLSTVLNACSQRIPESPEILPVRSCPKQKQSRSCPHENTAHSPPELPAATRYRHLQKKPAICAVDHADA